mgnify:CR=1 FL=1
MKRPIRPLRLKADAARQTPYQNPNREKEININI